MEQHEYSLDNPRFAQLLRRRVEHPGTGLICVRAHPSSSTHTVLPWTDVLDVDSPSGRFYYFVPPHLQYGLRDRFDLDYGCPVLLRTSELSLFS